MKFEELAAIAFNAASGKRKIENVGFLPADDSALVRLEAAYRAHLEGKIGKAEAQTRKADIRRCWEIESHYNAMSEWAGRLYHAVQGAVADYRQFRTLECADIIADLIESVSNAPDWEAE